LCCFLFFLPLPEKKTSSSRSFLEFNKTAPSGMEALRLAESFWLLSTALSDFFSNWLLRIPIKVLQELISSVKAGISAFSSSTSKRF